MSSFSPPPGARKTVKYHRVLSLVTKSKYFEKNTRSCFVGLAGSKRLHSEVHRVAHSYFLIAIKTISSNISVPLVKSIVKYLLPQLTNRMWFRVCASIVSPQHFDCCDDAVSLSIRVQTTLNHSRCDKYDRLRVAK